jgi:hypothetical protein
MLQPYWPEPLMPNYRSGRIGPWSCQPTPALTNVPGYFIPVRQQSPGWMFKKGRTVWMSLTRIEVESQMMHIAAARGHTVIGGMGMGFVLFNMAMKPEVTKITLLEIDPQVIELVYKVADLVRWPGYEKIEIVIGDAAEFKPHEPVDFLYMDTWSGLGSSKALPTTQQVQKNVQAASVGYWGQEFDLVAYCQDHGTPATKIGRAAYRRFAEAAELPLIEQDSLIYPRLATLAVVLQTAANTKDIPAKLILQKVAFVMFNEQTEIDAAISRFSR